MSEHNSNGHRSAKLGGSLLGRLQIRAAGDSRPPVPFDRKILWVKRILNVVLLIALGMIIALCLVPIEDIYVAEGVVRPGQYRRLYAASDLEQQDRPLVSEGQHVSAGQVLMRFHLPERQYSIMETRELLAGAKAELELQKAKTASFEKMPLPASLWEIKEQLAKSKFNRDYYQLQLARAQELAQSGDVSVQDVERAKLEFEQAKIEQERLSQRFELVDAGYTETLLKQAQAEENRIVSQIENVQQRLQSMEAELARLSVLRAPADGIILDLPQKGVIGMIDAGRELAYMSVGNERMVEIFGMQENFHRVQVNQQVRFKSRMYDPAKFGNATGHIVKIGQIRHPEWQSNASGAENRYYSILATIDEQPAELKLDSNVTAQIVLRKDWLIKVLFGKS